MTTDDPVLQVLLRVEARLDRLERRVEDLTRQAPGAVATAVDSADALMQRLVEAGVDPDARVAELLALGERVSDPQVAGALRGLLDRADLLEQAAELAGEGPGFAAMVTDILDAWAKEAQRHDLDLDQRVRGLGALLLAVTDPAVQRSGMLDPEVIGAVSEVGRAAAAARSQPPQPVGALALLRALRDPHVQRGLGFALAIARNLGEQLAPAPPTALTRRS